jgi:leader peptidase (prepilin peptidase) / N-methyltransferase
VDAAVILALGLIGAVFGSFLTVVAHRVPLGESVVAPRSRCPGCGTQLTARDNVPILSWLAARGRCRHCGHRVSARYPAIEASTAVSFAVIAAVRGVDEELLIWLPFAALLIALAAIDLEHQLLPNKIVLPGAVYALVASALIRPDELPDLLIAGAAAFIFLLVAALVHPAGMGMGDVKLAGMMGLFLGRAVAPALLFAFLAGTVVGLAIIAREGREARKSGVPFGPFLAFGGILAILVGDDLVEAYLDEFVR